MFRYIMGHLASYNAPLCCDRIVQYKILCLKSIGYEPATLPNPKGDWIHKMYGILDNPLASSFDDCIQLAISKSHTVHVVI